MEIINYLPYIQDTTMTKVVTTDNSGNITCAAEICDLISDCASIPHNKSLKVVGTELQLTDTLNDVIKCDVADLINKPDTPSVTNVKLYSDGKLLKLDDSAGATVFNDMVTNAQACLPDLTYSFLSKTSNASGDLLILDSTGKPSKRSDLSNLADGTTITYNQTSGKLSAVQSPPAPTPTYVHASDIPAESKSDTYPLTPAAVLAMTKYFKPFATSDAPPASMDGTDAVPFPMFYNFNCTGGTNGKPKFDVYVKDGSMCTVDLGDTGGSSGGSTAGTVVWEGMSNGCISLAGKGAGLYMAVCISTWDQQWGRDERFVLPFIFFDIPDPIDGKNVGMTYKYDSWANLVARPSECVVLQAKMAATGVNEFVNDGDGSSPMVVTPSNMVWQTFKSGLRVQDTQTGHNAHVVKVVKLT